MKEKDWLVANLNNPDFSYSQFKEAGLTMDNTQLLSKQEYKNSKYIQDKFTDENGKFNEVAFDKVYDTVSKTYAIHENEEPKINYVNVASTSAPCSDAVCTGQNGLDTKITFSVVDDLDDSYEKMSLCVA